MNNSTLQLVQLLKKKRESHGYSIRQLSSVIGVSFSTLARIERGDGEPDNNTKIRILEWLGSDARDAGLQFDSVALVHFRARKQINSETVKALLKVANSVKQEYGSNSDCFEITQNNGDDFEASIPLTKDEMETMAEAFRKDLGLSNEAVFKPFSLKVEGVTLIDILNIVGIDEQTKNHLLNNGKQQWSAMSVPLSVDTDKWVIVWNSHQSKRRQHVSILEEIWHILLGHKLTRITKVADIYGRTFAEVEEHDAYYLAAATLLPPAVVRKFVDEQQSTSEVASKYGTTPELLEYRIKRLGLWREYKGLKVEMQD
jgi:transcriptional regulator with XRE-family HTH domain